MATAGEQLRARAGEPTGDLPPARPAADSPVGPGARQVAQAAGLARRPRRMRPPRPAWLFLGLLLLLATGAWLSRPAPRDLAPARATVAWLGLTDLCLTTESPAGRNPALAEPALPLQLVPGGPEPFAALPFFAREATDARPPHGGRITPAHRPATAGGR